MIIKLLLPVFLLISTSGKQLLANNETTYFVIPDVGEITCPSYVSPELCHHLSYYINIKLSGSLINFVFLNGEHYMPQDFVLKGLDGVLFKPYDSEWIEGPNDSVMQSSVTIKCTTVDVVALNIRSVNLVAFFGLTITGCKTAIDIHNVSLFYMKMVSIQNSSSIGVSYLNYATGKLMGVNLEATSFYRNCLNPSTNWIGNRKCSHLKLTSNQHSTISFNITLSNFTNGMKLSSGIDIYYHVLHKLPIHKGNFLVHIAHCAFIQNNATGVAIESVSYLNISVVIIDSKFLYNTNCKIDMKSYSDIMLKPVAGLSIALLIHRGVVVIKECIFDGNYGGGAFIGAMAIKGDDTIIDQIFIADSTFQNNIGQYGAGLAVSIESVGLWISNTSIVNNTFDTSEVGQYSAMSLVCMSDFANVPVLSNMTISSNNMTGLILLGLCQFTVDDVIVISDNISPIDGAGMWIDDKAFISSLDFSKIIFKNNKASRYGGAIYCEANPFPYRLQQVNSFHMFGCSVTGLYAIFLNNTANYAGNDIYGGQFYHCAGNRSVIIDNNDFNIIQCTAPWFVFENISKPLSSSVSSDPFGVCLCTDISTTDCYNRSIHYKVYPGQSISLALVTVGMCGGISPGVIVIETNNLNVTLGNSYQQTMMFCSLFTYKLQKTATHNHGHLAIKTGSSYHLKKSSLLVDVSFLSCPAGLHLTTTGICDCNNVIGSVNGIKCNVSWSPLPVRRSGNIWLSYNHQQNCTVAHKNCPFDYCNVSAVSLNLNNPDIQCALNRSGILCGQCKPGLSLKLGSNQCSHCENKYIFLSVVFIGTGLLLVVLLLVFNLTVSVGSINGLLFYANTIKLNEAVFFPNGVSIPVLSQFIAWLNLDLGIQTCFFDGLDGYWKTWLQFVFPVYIWLLIGGIIITSHYFGKIARLFGNNAVPVLATLILISYSKLLRTIANALMISIISCNGSEWSVWSLDGNISYLNAKRAPLFSVSVLFLLLGLIYAALVFSAQWVQKCTGKLNFKSSFDLTFKLKPLIDSYSGPYKDKYRFWTGLLLVVRVIHTAVFSITTSTVPQVNNYVIIATLLLLMRIGDKRMYKVNFFNHLEYFHYFNLVFLSLFNALSDHILTWSYLKVYISVVSVTISLVVFLFTVLAHVWIKIKTRLAVKCLCRSNLTVLRVQKLEEVHLLKEESSSQEELGSPAHIIQRREPLIFDFDNLDIQSGKELN